MKRFIRSICLVLSLVLLMAIPVSAAGNDVKSSSYFSASSTYLSKVSGSTFDICYHIVAVGTMDKIGAQEITLERSSDGVNWKTIKTYSSDSYSSMISSNTYFHIGSFRYIGTPGFYYRATVKYYAKKGTGSGVVYSTTQTMQL